MPKSLPVQGWWWNHKRIYWVHKAMNLPLRRLAEKRLRTERDLPQGLRTGNGPAFLGEAVARRARQVGMAIQYIQPGKPNQNGDIERFNRTFREELLDQHLFATLDDVREAVYG